MDHSIEQEAATRAESDCVRRLLLTTLGTEHYETLNGNDLSKLEPNNNSLTTEIVNGKAPVGFDYLFLIRYLTFPIS
jgi:hypothetical protein